MLFYRKRDLNESIPLKQEIFEDAIHENKILKAICVAEAIAIATLIIIFIVKVA